MERRTTACLAVTVCNSAGRTRRAKRGARTVYLRQRTNCKYAVVTAKYAKLSTYHTLPSFQKVQCKESAKYVCSTRLQGYSLHSIYGYYRITPTALTQEVGARTLNADDDAAH